MKGTNSLMVIFLAVITSYLFKKHMLQLKRSMFFFDTIGLGLFTILGIQKTMELGLNSLIAVLTNVIPLIFRREIYASACLVGEVIFLALCNYSEI